jgi:hypothetical protein
MLLDENDVANNFTRVGEMSGNRKSGPLIRQLGKSTTSGEGDSHSGINDKVERRK